MPRLYEGIPFATIAPGLLEKMNRLRKEDGLSRDGDAVFAYIIKYANQHDTHEGIFHGKEVKYHKGEMAIDSSIIERVCGWEKSSSNRMKAKRVLEELEGKNLIVVTRVVKNKGGFKQVALVDIVRKEHERDAIMAKRAQIPNVTLNDTKTDTLNSHENQQVGPKDPPQNVTNSVTESVARSKGVPSKGTPSKGSKGYNSLRNNTDRVPQRDADINSEGSKEEDVNEKEENAFEPEMENEYEGDRLDPGFMKHWTGIDDGSKGSGQVETITETQGDDFLFETENPVSTKQNKSGGSKNSSDNAPQDVHIPTSWTGFPSGNDKPLMERIRAVEKNRKKNRESLNYRYYKVDELGEPIKTEEEDIVDRFESNKGYFLWKKADLFCIQSQNPIANLPQDNSQITEGKIEKLKYLKENEINNISSRAAGYLLKHNGHPDQLSVDFVFDDSRFQEITETRPCYGGFPDHWVKDGRKYSD